MSMLFQYQDIASNMLNGLVLMPPEQKTLLYSIGRLDTCHLSDISNKPM